jgi:orotate phosphoribosyltransferase
MNSNKGVITMDYKNQIAKLLLDIKAVFFRPGEVFIWASGIKSPIYCDNRLALSDVSVRNEIETAIAQTIKENFAGAEILMGTSTAGIPHAAIASHLLGLPMGYVRTGAKDHGRKNKIEGRLAPGQKAVVVEDLISTGGSVIDVVETLREAGADVLGVVSIFTYNMAKGIERLEKAGIKNISLTNFDTVVEVGVESGYIEKADVPKLMAFRDNPSDESWIWK